MTLTLSVATRQWRDHLRSLQSEVPGLVPVAKGNGYGFGLEVLAREAMRIRASTIAVGVAEEVTQVRLAGYTRDVVVLNPWRPGDGVATALLSDPRVITTISRPEDLATVADLAPRARVQLELLTSMRRHGLGQDQLTDLELRDLAFEGWTIHLPATGSLEEAEQLARAGLEARRGAVWVSHIDVADYRLLRTRLGIQTRMRIGTRLWLGAPEALTTRATVLDVHPISRGERLGYHQSRAPRDGWIVVVSGGTAHGIALAAPVPQRSLRQRGVTVAEGLLQAAGQSLSPFTLGRRKRAFAEPPHMHSSMVFVPGREPGVAVGDEVPVTCRMTTTRFDQVTWR